MKIIVSFIVGIALGCFVERFLKLGDPAQAENSQRPFTDVFKEAQKSNSPVQFNVNVNEYQIVHEYDLNGEHFTARYPLIYCPWTGVKLPKSRRPDAQLLFDANGNVILKKGNLE